jgi:hypothetical protein
VANASALHLIVHLAEPMHEQDKVRTQRTVDEQLTAPVTVGTLLSQQIFLRAVDRFRNPYVCCGIHLTNLRSSARQGYYVGRPIHS